MISQRQPPALTDRNVEGASLLEANKICSYLEWDSDFFGKRIARLNPSRLNGSTLSEALRWCVDHRIDCLYFLADADDEETRRVAEQNDFAEVDVRLALSRPITEEDHRSMPASDPRIRLAQDSDLEVLRRIAGTLHRDTRFYVDKHFERDRCDLLYKTWIEKSLQGFAQTVFVPEVDSQPVGYVTGRCDDQVGQIGLLGVAGSHARAGLGKALVQRFLSWSAQQGAVRASVVTQSRNTAAQGLYQHCGFVQSSLQRWYHRWFDYK